MACGRVSLILELKGAHVSHATSEDWTHTATFDEVGHCLLLKDFASEPSGCHFRPRDHTLSSFDSYFSHQLVRFSVFSLLLCSLCSQLISPQVCGCLPVQPEVDSFYTYIHTYTHTYTHTCIHTHMHTYIHTHTHTTHTHTYIHTSLVLTSLWSLFAEVSTVHLQVHCPKTKSWFQPTHP